VYQHLVAGLDELAVERVFVATVPHVTIAPLARGVGKRPADRLSGDSRYFQFYTYFWITDAVFDPQIHPHLTGQQAQEIDRFIDSYNDTIRAVVQQHQQHGQQWFLVDLAGALDRLAFRRYREVGTEPPGGTYEFPAAWREALRSADIPELTTEYLGAEQNRLQRGGLFSLDGVHPTTMGYSLIAQEFLRVMHAEAKVAFINPGTGAPRPEPLQIDFARLLQHDLLVRTPPGLLDDTTALFNWLDGWIGLSGILRRIA
jgi:phospholipase/lecithinase/hemolysin